MLTIGTPGGKMVLGMKVAVGRFSLEGGELTGPAEYMAEKGNALVERCLSGQSAVFNYGLAASPNPETALLVALQTDYAGWLGMRQLNLMRKGKG